MTGIVSSETATVETASDDGKMEERDNKSPDLEIVMVETPKQSKELSQGKAGRQPESDSDRPRRRKHSNSSSSEEQETDKFGRVRRKLRKRSISGSSRQLTDLPVDSKAAINNDGNQEERDEESSDLEIVKVELPTRRYSSESSYTSDNSDRSYDYRHRAITSSSSDGEGETDKFGRLRRNRSRSRSPSKSKSVIPQENQISQGDRVPQEDVIPEEKEIPQEKEIPPEKEKEIPKDGEKEISEEKETSEENKTSQDDEISQEKEECISECEKQES